jgi:hypothetical protein
MKPRIANRRTPIIVICVLVLVVLLPGVYFGPQIVMYFRIRSSLNDAKWRISILRSVPKPLNETAVSTAEGTTISYFGYRFEVPWTGIEREINEGRRARINFSGGQTIECTNPRYFQEDPIQRKRAVYPSMFDRAFGPTVKASKYKQFREIMSWTPEQLQPFCSRQNFARSVVLLQFKADWFGWNTAVPDIYPVRTDHYQGFETSRSSKEGQRVTLVLFDETDRWFQVTVSTPRTDVQITQPEINRIIQTFRPAPTRDLNSVEK